MSSNGNDFDRTVDQIATFFKGAAKMQQVVKDMGMDKPPPPKVDFAHARKLFEAWAETFDPQSKWIYQDRDAQYRWLDVARAYEGL